MVRLDAILNEVENKQRSDRKGMQVEAMRTIRERGVADGALARYLQTDLRQVHAWAEGKAIARPPMLAHLVYLSRLPRLPDMETRPKVRRGRIPNQNIEELQARMKAHGLWPPRRRAKTLQALKEATGLVIVDFAARLGVGKTQAYKYLDPGYTPVMSQEVIDNVIRLRQEVAAAPAPLSPEAEFRSYLKVLFGPRYASRGLPANSPLKARAFRELRRRTGMTDLVLESNLPPNRTEGAPRRSVIRMFKLAAEQGPLLPELAGSPGAGSKAQAATARN